MQLDTTTLLAALVAGILLLGSLYFLLQSPGPARLPLVNAKQPSEIRSIHAQNRFLFNARKLISDGLAKWPAFNIVTENGIRLILGPQYATELRSHQDLSFGKAIGVDFHADLPGFEPFRQGTRAEEITQDVVRMKLTQSLAGLTKPLSEETINALETNWTDNPEWHKIPLKTTILQIVAQLSAKVFIGDSLCRNQNWLRITVDYAVDSFLAAEALRLWPSITRPLIAYFHPRTRKIQGELKEARRIMAPVLAQRRAEKQAAAEAGEEPKRYTDALEWMEQCAKGRPFDAAVAQIGLSLAAIHTSSDMLTQVLYDIAQQEGLAEEMRREIVDVIRADGWAKTTLYKLRLMDSVLKESQRLKPAGIATMRRMAVKDITLSDGTVIPKSAITFVSVERQWDAAVYEDPLTFNPYRYLRLRDQPGHETSSQLVAPSVEHMGFGFGRHACPGRFFAANEIKIALCHILLEYDLRLVEGKDPKPFGLGMALGADPMAEVEIRRREAEI
ncbi:cytochrome P450 [Aspergillus californicus]